MSGEVEVAATERDLSDGRRHDRDGGEGQRLVQLTPPGSGCAIGIGEGAVPPMSPGSIRGLQLVVPGIEAAHSELTARGEAVSDVQAMGENAGPGDPLDNVGFAFFDAPDGISWAVQQISYPRGGAPSA